MTVPKITAIDMASRSSVLDAPLPPFLGGFGVALNGSQSPLVTLLDITGANHNGTNLVFASFNLSAPAGVTAPTSDGTSITFSDGSGLADDSEAAAARLALLNSNTFTIRMVYRPTAFVGNDTALMFGDFGINGNFFKLEILQSRRVRVTFRGLDKVSTSIQSPTFMLVDNLYDITVTSKDGKIGVIANEVEVIPETTVNSYPVSMTRIMLGGNLNDDSPDEHIEGELHLLTVIADTSE